MKTLALAGAALLVAGVGSWMLLSADDDGGKASDDPPGASSSSRDDRRPHADGPVPDVSLEGRVAQLEGEVKSLRRQLAMMQGARAAFAGRSDLDDDDDGGFDAAEMPAFDDAVRDIVLEEREREREERDERRREQWEARAAEALEELVAEAGLDGTQRDAIETAWASEREQMIPLFSAARSGERDFGEIRTQAREIREATDADIQKLLSAEQFEKYEEARPRGRDRRGERGDRGERRRDG